jgi:hypothetical protein
VLQLRIDCCWLILLQYLYLVGNDLLVWNSQQDASLDTWYCTEYGLGVLKPNGQRYAQHIHGKGELQVVDLLPGMIVV